MDSVNTLHQEGTKVTEVPGADFVSEFKGEDTASDLDIIENPPSYSRELAEQHNSTVPFIHRPPLQVLQAAFANLDPDSYEAVKV